MAGDQLFEQEDVAASEQSLDFHAPLAARMRPRQLDEYFGQSHLLASDRPLRKALEQGHLHSMILWGPPGVGKTSLVKLFAHTISAHFISLSAVMSGVKDIRAAVDEAKFKRQQGGKRTVLFIDEVHRFNKSQQDAFLPYVEEGLFVFVGATTENPSFEVNNALLSRCRVYSLQSLSEEALASIINHALRSERGLGPRKLRLGETELHSLVRAADGDARRALNLLEIASDFVEDDCEIGEDALAQVMQGDTRRFDKGGDVFYEQISALHKSVRGSDPDASLYWLMRMLDGGCEPAYLARRLVRIASEDIGNADPRALQITLNAWEVQERVGSPEGELALAQATLYLAVAAKSNAVYSAFKSAQSDVKSQPSYEVPEHLRNAPTALMKNMGYGAEYRYAHDEDNAFAAGVNYFPEAMGHKRYYSPVSRGLEIKIGEKLAALRRANDEAKSLTPKE